VLNRIERAIQQLGATQEEHIRLTSDAHATLARVEHKTAEVARSMQYQAQPGSPPREMPAPSLRRGSGEARPGLAVPLALCHESRSDLRLHLSGEGPVATSQRFSSTHSIGEDSSESDDDGSDDGEYLSHHALTERAAPERAVSERGLSERGWNDTRSAAGSVRWDASASFASERRGAYSYTARTHSAANLPWKASRAFLSAESVTGARTARHDAARRLIAARAADSNEQDGHEHTSSPDLFSQSAFSSPLLKRPPATARPYYRKVTWRDEAMSHASRAELRALVRALQSQGRPAQRFPLKKPASARPVRAPSVVSSTAAHSATRAHAQELSPEMDSNPVLEWERMSEHGAAVRAIDFTTPGLACRAANLRPRGTLPTAVQRRPLGFAN